jgi:hypothetical protein
VKIAEFEHGGRAELKLQAMSKLILEMPLFHRASHRSLDVLPSESAGSRESPHKVTQHLEEELQGEESILAVLRICAVIQGLRYLR